MPFTEGHPHWSEGLRDRGGTATAMGTVQESRQDALQTTASRQWVSARPFFPLSGCHALRSAPASFPKDALPPPQAATPRSE